MWLRPQAFTLMAWAIGVVPGAMLMAGQTANPMMERLVKAVPIKEMVRMEVVRVAIAEVLLQAPAAVAVAVDTMEQEQPKAAAVVVAVATAPVVAAAEPLETVHPILGMAALVAPVVPLVKMQAVAARQLVIPREVMEEMLAVLEVIRVTLQ